MSADSAKGGSAAVLNASGRYRYWLRRCWGSRPAARGRVVFVLLNPSTADAARDDPTVRRCRGLAARWGYSSLEIVNLFAHRATRPAQLRAVRDPVGPGNDRYLARALRRAAKIVVAWGNHGRILRRDAAVLAMLRCQRRRIHCLGITRQGSPRHPLYVRGNARPIVFPRSSSDTQVPR